AEVDGAASTGGRPSSRFAFNPRARVVIAADFGASHSRIAVTNLAGELLADTSSTREIAEGPRSAIDWLRSTALELLERAGRGVGRVVGIRPRPAGPGEVPPRPPNHPANHPRLEPIRRPRAPKEALRPPVFVDNDVNIMALGERTTAWPETTDLIFVKVATGIGAGIISGGSLRRGSHGAAGDIGHVTLPRAAEGPCACGNRGCLEAGASGRAIARSLSAAGVPAATPSDVVELVKSGDVHAVQAVRQAGRDLGEVLTTCVSLMNPSLILIGGTMAQAAEHL